MGRTHLLVLIMFLLLVLGVTGCGKGTGDPSSQGGTGESEGISGDEVVEMHGQIENVERLDQFVRNVQEEKKDSVRLIRYTIEGDPIYYDMAFEKEKLVLTVDTTEDEFGAKEVRTVECRSITKEETDTSTEYSLGGCPDSEARPILEIRYDSEEQDYFAIRLKVDDQLEVDTRDGEIEKRLDNGEKKRIDDFQFNTDELNRIYKALVYSNYLEEKDLSTECKQEGDKSYHLTVWINQAERQYEWSSCDNSEDGRDMTKVVDTILSVLDENEMFK